MFRATNTFEKNLENATSHLRLDPDWPSILLICDAIRQNDVRPKTAFMAIKKKMSSANPHSAYYSLLVLDCVVKNCGAPMHDEIFTKANCEMFSTFLDQTPHKDVRTKMLELIQTWANVFGTSDKYQSIKDIMTILKAKGYNFPELKEPDAMFSADTAPDWADGKVCNRCRVEFSFTQRKHHCRNCGQIFCNACTSKLCPLPKYGFEKDVRVCDTCYVSLNKKSKKPESELPVEYLNSSLAQQTQTPQRSEAEIKEEEELQLAIALSQSEAEQKTKTTSSTNNNYRSYQRSPSPEAPSASIISNSILGDEPPVDPELARYLNRSYWEQRKAADSPVSPSAPSPMPQQASITVNKIPEDIEIDEFANNMKTQVEIFVNRMKSYSSRGRSISNDTSVQTLFMNLTMLHSRLLTYIKEVDDKRMWYEQLQDKMSQVKDSRAALDVLRQEHVEKIRRIAEEHERQRQKQMAEKLEIMRKKKQEYMQYQHKLALERIQEQEREMQVRQEQQKAQYRINQTAFPFIANSGVQGSPNHQINQNYYAFNPNSPNMPRYNPQGQAAPPQTQPSMQNMHAPGIGPLQNQSGMSIGGQVTGIPTNNMMTVMGPQQMVGTLQQRTTEGMTNISMSPNITTNSNAVQQVGSPLLHGMMPVYMQHNQPNNGPGMSQHTQMMNAMANLNVNTPQNINNQIAGQNVHPSQQQQPTMHQQTPQSQQQLPSHIQQPHLPHVQQAHQIQHQQQASLHQQQQQQNSIQKQQQPIMHQQQQPPMQQQQQAAPVHVAPSENQTPIGASSKESSEEEINDAPTAELISFD